VLPATRLEAQADALLKTMARHGTATIGAMTGYGDGMSGELKILRALHSRTQKPLEVVSILYSTGRDGGLEREELLNTVARRKLAGIAAVRCGEGGVSDAEAEVYLDGARALGMGLRLELLERHGNFLVETAVHRKALSVAATGGYRLPEIELLAGTATVAILLPYLSMRSWGPPMPSRELINSGVAIALGSGFSAAGGGTASMQSVIQMACSCCALSIEEAISAATINAACAIGVGMRTGSLEHGKSGDIILLNVSDYREIPLFTGTNLTHSMLRRGVVLFEEDFPGWQEQS
jgi:imidazolonepropionase